MILTKLSLLLLRNLKLNFQPRSYGPTRAGYTLEVRVSMFPLRVGAGIEQCLAIEDYSGFSRVM